ncbi:hypothetical protein ACFLT7_02105 [candidate division KSB1 bacterium]
MTPPQTIELVVSLRVPDVVAATALRALKDRLDFDKSLHGLRRHDYHRLEIDNGDDTRARQLARALIEKTTTFVNPNKHSYSIKLDGQYLVPAKSTPELPDGVRTVRFLVLPDETEDSTAAVELLRRKLGEPAISSLSSGVLWELFIRADDDREARKTALDIAVARERDKGLLLNPHYQRYEIL